MSLSVGDARETRLDLSENLVLLLYPGGVALVDQRPPHECHDAPCWEWKPTPDSAPMALYTLMEAHARPQDGEWLPLLSLAPEPVHQAYGNRVIQAQAVFAGGITEDWTLRVDPLHVGFDWIRQPHDTGTQCSFHIKCPALNHGLQFWQTESGQQSERCCDGNVPAQPEEPQEMTAGAAFFYCDIPRAAMRVQTVSPGALRIAIDAAAPAGARPHEDHAGCWHVDWRVLHGQLIHLSGNVGIHSATRRQMDGSIGSFADASVDFGSYYMQTLLGGLALLEEPGRLPRASTLHGSHDAQQAGLDEIALAAESLGICAPQWVAMQLRRAIERHVEMPSSLPLLGELDLFQEAAPALVLLMAGRYLRLTGDMEFIFAHAAELRQYAAAMLALRRPNEALPSFASPEGGPRVKQPGSTAIVSAGLSRWAAIEARLGEAAQSKHYADAAMAMQWAAVAPIQSGGLWHLGRGTFVHYRLAVEDSPRDPEDLPGAEFNYGQQLLALWLGLCPDDDMVRRSFEWVDYAYTYATGRGGPAYPPGYNRGFHSLIDVAVRARYNCGGIETVLQRALDMGARGGMPVTMNLRGNPLPAGTLLDNAPYFELVLRRHYGLDYDAGGWRLFTPQPLANYPLTRVTNLRHRNALYAITWQGRGAIQRVAINGAPHPTRVLDKESGEHEVVVTLA